MSMARHHAEWRALLEVSGPFLALEILEKVFPQGLDKPGDESAARTRLKNAYEEWQEAGDEPAIHRAFIELVLKEVLELGEVLASGQGIPSHLRLDVAEHGEKLVPAYAVIAPEGPARLLVTIHPQTQALDRTVAGSRWPTSPETRMMELCHATGVKLGLVTNGERWVLVHAPQKQTTSYVGFYTSIWIEEPLTLRAFRSLLGMHRFFGVADDATLEAMFAKSAGFQKEVTDKLGLQVRRAVEVLIQAIDRINRERRGELLHGTDEKRLYEAAVTFMMRLVFALAAEERRLFPLGSEPYDASYAVSTLRDQLREAADRHGEEVLERRHDAYGRLLATFRAIHGGVQYGTMTLPAYGGSLFDPDRFPFLEGRADKTEWRETPASPLPIHNRTVLHLLEALQFLAIAVPGGGTELQRLSFRAIGVEQIGHVYEGLLDHTAVRARETVIGLAAGKDAVAEVAVTELDRAAEKSSEDLVALLRERTGKSENAVRKAIAYQVPSDDHRLLAACENVAPVYKRVEPYAGLLREDTSGYPVVYPKGSVYVTTGSDRRSTGTHYTPPDLTEPIVRHTLDPLVYVGPAEGLPQADWKLKSPREILALRVCDLAMGSGAFLVQACRYLGMRLVEAWVACEERGGGRLVVTPEGELSTGKPSEQPLPRDLDERLLLAMRFIADRCLYGVDRNPMAVEMGKLSLWLTTMHKGRPFTFVDHALRPGDSLLGLTSAPQLERFHLDPTKATKLVLGVDAVGRALKTALGKRRELEGFTVRERADAARKERLLAEAQHAVQELRVTADLLVGSGLQSVATGSASDASLGISVAAAFKATGKEREARFDMLAKQAAEMLGGRRPFHWVLEFPEVMAREHPGFDALLGNPPFQYGTLAATLLSETYMRFLQQQSPPWHGKADLVVGFLKRALAMAASHGHVGLLATASALRGESLESGIRPALASGWNISGATSPQLWPGTANVDYISLVLSQHWTGKCLLDGENVDSIGEDLSPASADTQGQPEELAGGVEAYMGVKLSPGNPQINPAKLPTITASARKAYAPTIGGDELYSLIDPVSDSWPTIDPEYLASLSANKLADVLRAVGASALDDLEHSRPASAMRLRLREANLAFACGETSVHLAYRAVPTSGVLIKHKCIVFPANDWSTFALLQSNIHVFWAWRWGLRRQARLTYSAKRCAQTFPLPDSDLIEANLLGQAYHDAREQLIADHREGLTETYNRFHNIDDRDRGIQKLRELHVEMDQAVAAAYGWKDLDLGHGFHDTKQGKRFTLSEPAREEVLARLLELNHARYAEEVAAGLHEKDLEKKAKAGEARAAKVPEEQLDMFGAAPEPKGPTKRPARSKNK